MMAFITFTDGRVGSYKAYSYRMNDSVLTLWMKEGTQDAMFIPFTQIRHIEIQANEEAV